MSGDVLALLAVLALTGVLAAVWRLRQGRVTSGGGRAFDRQAVGATPGTPLLVEFSAPGCGPCHQAEQALREAADRHGGVTLVIAGVGEHLALAREHGIVRAPTTLVVADDDRVLHRISGVPDPREVVALLGGARRLQDRRAA